jgi:hypothetical protein
MSKTTSLRPDAARQLPERPSLDHLKGEAKRRLNVMRAEQPAAKLADAQFALAREYGFASWRELKAAIDGVTGTRQVEALGDWIGALTSDVRVALHVRSGENGLPRATLDSPDFGAYQIPVDDVAAGDNTLSFALLYPEVNATSDATWDAAAQQWSGSWLQNGIPMPPDIATGRVPATRHNRRARWSVGWKARGG